MVVTLGQQYNIGEKLTVIRYLIAIQERTPDKYSEGKNNSTSSNMVVVIILYCYYVVGCEDEVTTVH